MRGIDSEFLEDDAISTTPLITEEPLIDDDNDGLGQNVHCRRILNPAKRTFQVVKYILCHVRDAIC